MCKTFSIKRSFSVLRLLMVVVIMMTVSSSHSQTCYPDFYVSQVYPYGALCSPQYVTLRAEQYYYTNSGEFRWYSSETDPYPVYTGYYDPYSSPSSDYTVYASQSTMIWTSFYDYSTGCETERIPYSFYFSTPAYLYLDYARVCGDGVGKIQLSSNISGVIFELYEAYYNPSLQYNYIGSNSSGYFELSYFDYNNPGKYYCRVYQPYGCGSNYFYPVNFDISDPQQPSISGSTTICVGNSTTLTASGNADNFRWYDASNNLIVESATYNVPNNLSVGTYTYYVSGISYGGCESGRQTVNVVVDQIPVDGTISASASAIYLGQPVTIRSQGGLGLPYYWCSTNGGQTWEVLNGAYAGQYSFTHTPSAVGTYRYHLRNRTGCGFCWDSPGSCIAYAYVDVTVFPRPSNAENQNYIKVRQFTHEGIKDEPIAASLTDVREVRQSTQYFDGLGRLMQTVTKQSSKIGNEYKDVVLPTVYDEFGREALKYLPYVATLSDGLYKIDPLGAQHSFYTGASSPIAGQGETFFHGQTQFEASPLNRVTKSLAPGDSWIWSNKGVSFNYWNNTATDTVRIWTVTNGTSIGDFGSYTSLATYPAGELYKNVTEDEHGKQVVEFKDKEGKVILKKVQLTAAADDGTGSGYTGWLCTYYIYDDLSNLRCVIQPRGVELINSTWSLSDATILKEQCFRYEYDKRNRMIIKKVPGAGEVWMVYDQWDRLVLTQDANLRNAPNKWMFTKYDKLNRPIVTGFYTYAASSQNAMQDYLMGLNMARYENYQPASFPIHSLDQSFPQVTFSDVLTITYYDDYSWAGWYGNYSTKDNSFDGYCLIPGSAYPYAQPLVQSNQTKGFITGVWQNNGNLTANYYDDKGRVIQTKSYNHTGGIDINTVQYNFSGQPLITVNKQEKAGASAQTTIILTRLTYDDLGRVIQIDKKVRNTLINGGNFPSDWTTIVQNEYDALGQLKKKKLGKKPGATPHTPLGNLSYDYNIRGWLLSVNKQYITATTNNDEYFGMQLGYDKNGSFGSFAPQFNGNIGGTLWKSEGDQQKRKYDYSYDAVNRLTAAPFSQYVSGTGTAAIFDATSSGLNFSVDNLSYDGNGNIKSMRQHGFKGTTSGVIDDFSYNYKDNEISNRLLAVTESSTINTTDHKVGDFTDKNRSLDDYDYDANGNLIYDKNKNISSITYNHLNLPLTVSVTGKGTITYTYDASGNKLKKVSTDNTVTDTTITTTTLYNGQFVYESRITIPSNNPNDDYTDRLLFIAHEEGRIRFVTATPATCTPQPDRLIYDYFIKDHLGNTRMVLTEQNESICYPAATVEDATIDEEKKFFKIEDPRVVSNSTGVSGFGNKTYKTHGNVTGQKTGLEMVFKVMSGDEVKIFGESYYDLPGGGAGGPLTMALTDLLAAFTGNSLIAGKGISSTTDISNVGTNASDIIQFLNNSDPGPSSAKASINWILFDDQFKYVASDLDFVQTGGGHKQHTKFINAPVNITKNGYLYIYASNQSDFPVFFDNLNVTHTNGPIMEETHYYPFGLTMAGISSKAMGKLDNKKEFNGNELQNKEFTDGSGLELYDFNARTYDQQVGRFIQIDPMTDEGGQESLTPYQFSYNNPVRYNDPDGKCPVCPAIPFIVPALEALATAVGTYVTADVAAKGTAHLIKNGDPDRIPLSMNIDGSTWPTMPIEVDPSYARTFMKGNEASGNASGTKLTKEEQAELNRPLVKPKDTEAKGRGKNNRKPDPEATGDHTVSNDKGSTTYQKNDKNPTGFDEVKRVDTKGKAHGGVPTPHVHEKGKKVRPAKEEEIPKSDLQKNKKTNTNG